MDCKKKKFKTSREANKRKNEINKDNQRNKVKVILRYYKCNKCGSYPLTKMEKHQYNYRNNIDYRNKVNETLFINRETEYWENKFNIKR